MKANRVTALLAVLLGLPSTVLAGTWYVDGVSGSNHNNCKSAQTACKTIRHAISLAHSGDSIMVAAATYTENVAISVSVSIMGADAGATIIDGGGVGRVIVVRNTATNVTISNVTISNGSTNGAAGISNGGTLTINNSAVSGNTASCHSMFCSTGRGGIGNSGKLTINDSTISGNAAVGYYGGSARGGGIGNSGTLIINNSTIAGNSAYGGIRGGGAGLGGGIYNVGGTVTISNSTVSGNIAAGPGGGFGSGIYTGSATTVQNSIVAGNTGGNCYENVISNGYNLSDDNTCNFNGLGDLNNTNPMLGPLQNNGGPTQTMALSSGSPAIDAGNPDGCKDGDGHLLTSDQRGMPRPDPEDTGGCDMGSYESQSD